MEHTEGERARRMPANRRPWAIIAGILLGLVVGIVAAQGARTTQADVALFLPLTIGRSAFTMTPVGRGFKNVTEVTHAGDERLFVAELSGVVKILKPDGQTTVFLDWSDEVLVATGEYGFYDIAFHPGYLDPTSPGYGFFYVAYTRGLDDGENRNVDLVISRFRVSADPDIADPASETRLLMENQRSNVHKGGALDFDRRDSMLYAGVGDDRLPLAAQQDGTPKGKIIRLAVDQVPASTTGDGTPFVEPAIVAFGLRNPWRIDVDEPSNRLFIGEVGNLLWEEVNMLDLAGEDNFGWPCLEGPFEDPTFQDNPLCQSSFSPAIYEYPHDASRGNCAIIAGRVYRPRFHPADGRFIFGDLCTREISALSEVDGAWQSALLGQQSHGTFTTIGEGADGTLYLGSFSESAPIYRLYIP